METNNLGLNEKTHIRYYSYGTKLFNLIRDLINIDQKNSNAEEIEIKKWDTVNKVITKIFKSDVTVHIAKLPTGSGKTANIIQWLLYIIIFIQMKIKFIDYSFIKFSIW